MPRDPIIDEVKEYLQNCKTIQDVNACAREYGPLVISLSSSKNVDDRVASIHIKNLAAYRRMCIKNGWV